VKSRHLQCTSPCPLWAKSGLMHRSKRYFDLIHLRRYRAIRTSTTTTNSDQRLQAPSKRAEALSLMTERGPLCDSEVEPWRSRTTAPSPCSVEPGFSATASFGIFVGVGFLFGLHRGIRTGLMRCLLSMIRNFNRSERIFTTNSRSRARLPVLTVW